MDTRGKKRKREQQLLRPALEGAIVKSPPPPPALSTSARAAELESGEGSSESVTSDAGSAKAAADDVLHIADALCKVCAKSPKAVVEFVRRVSPATVGRSIDWDVIREDDARKMSEGRHRWTDMEVRVFLESCVEEIAAYNITSNTPKNKAWDNLQQKMYDKCRKVVNRGQLQYEWRECKKRFNDWVWLQSQATGLGRDPHTSAIVADESWWKSKNGLRKGVLAFRNDPLKHIDLHHAVFGGRTVVGNHSGIAGAAQAAPQGAIQWQTIDVTQLTATYRPPAPSAAAPPTADRGKGKRPAAESSASGGSRKKSRSDSTGQALERLAALRMESMESRAREAAAAKAVGVEACLQLVENDGHRIGGPVWYAACRLFHDQHHCFCFVRLPDAATRLEYISTAGQGGDSSSGATQ